MGLEGWQLGPAASVGRGDRARGRVRIQCRFGRSVETGPRLWRVLRPKRVAEQNMELGRQLMEPPAPEDGAERSGRCRPCMGPSDSTDRAVWRVRQFLREPVE